MCIDISKYYRKQNEDYHIGCFQVQGKCGCRGKLILQLLLLLRDVDCPTTAVELATLPGGNDAE